MNRVLRAHCSCEDVGERLSEYLDLELGTLDRTRVALHLAETIRAVHRSSGWIARRLGRFRH